MMLLSGYEDMRLFEWYDDGAVFVGVMRLLSGYEDMKLFEWYDDDWMMN